MRKTSRALAKPQGIDKRFQDLLTTSIPLPAYTLRTSTSRTTNIITSKMPPAIFVITSLDLPEVGSLWNRICEFVADHMVVISLPNLSFEFLSEWWANFLAWLLRPGELIQTICY